MTVCVRILLFKVRCTYVRHRNAGGKDTMHADSLSLNCSIKSDGSFECPI